MEETNQVNEVQAVSSQAVEMINVQTYLQGNEPQVPELSVELYESEGQNYWNVRASTEKPKTLATASMLREIADLLETAYQNSEFNDPNW